MADRDTTPLVDFDPDALREKYRAERDKRLRSDGNEQYAEVVGDLAHYVNDPYTIQAERAPVTDHVEAVIIGGGFGGLIMGARLRDAGFEDIRVVEKGGEFGGTWYWNRYPGAACDIESYVYLPLLEETGYIPTEKYARGPEILEHSIRIARHYNLYDKALLQTEITQLTWDDVAGNWTLESNRGDRFTAKYVILSSGPLHKPKLPGIPGVERFKGHAFHTSRWDYGYTGGNSDGGLSKLHDKRVGIIGTGATAVQCVPNLADGAKELCVFQRTPSSVGLRNNQDTDQNWAASLEPGWHRYRMENFNTLISGGFASEDLVNDGWTEIIRELLFMASQEDSGNLSPEKLAEIAELADFRKMEEMRALVDELVEDQRTAEALKPWYRQFCKRPCFHDKFLASFNRPNVTLVDTDGQGVEQITETAVIANGKTYEVDCLIYATGFEVGTSYTRRSGFELTGRGGRTLTEAWADGVRTLYGMHTRGFPNAFVMGMTQAGFVVNYPHLLVEQAEHLTHTLVQANKRQATRVEVSEAAEQDWVDIIVSKADLRADFLEACTPGYFNNEGNLAERNSQNQPYGGGSVEYFDLLKTWRSNDDLAGLEVH